MSGVDFPSVILRDTLGLPVPEYRYESGKILRYMGLDCHVVSVFSRAFSFPSVLVQIFGKNIFMRMAIGMTRCLC